MLDSRQLVLGIRYSMLGARSSIPRFVDPRDSMPRSPDSRNSLPDTRYSILGTRYFHENATQIKPTWWLSDFCHAGDASFHSQSNCAIFARAAGWGPIRGAAFSIATSRGLSTDRSHRTGRWVMAFVENPRGGSSGFVRERPGLGFLRYSASFRRAADKGSYTSPVFHRECSNTASFRATATTARFFARAPAPPLARIRSPYRRRSQSGPR